MPTEQSPAPDFSLLADDGSTVTLTSLRGRPAVIYFYPKDNTPGCTKESCDFRDAFPRFTDANARIIGVSADSVASHVKFKRKYQLPFTLLADEEHHMSEAYEVWKRKSLFGLSFMGIERTTFILDSNGIIAKIFPKVKPIGHAAAVEAALKSVR